MLKLVGEDSAVQWRVPLLCGLRSISSRLSPRGWKGRKGSEYERDWVSGWFTEHCGYNKGVWSILGERESHRRSDASENKWTKTIISANLQLSGHLPQGPVTSVHSKMADGRQWLELCTGKNFINFRWVFGTWLEFYAVVLVCEDI